jgi:RND superfamily putative drug exporter
VVTLLALLLASLKFFSNLGPSAALAIACMLVAGLTLVPAILVLLGRAAFWPVMPRFGEGHGSDRGLWSRVAEIVARRPAAVLAATGMLFVALALCTFTLEERYDFTSNLPPSSESRQGQALLERAGPADIGKLSPTLVFVTSSDSVGDHLPQLAAISDSVAKANGVQTVTGFGGSPPPSAAQVVQRDQSLPAGQRMVSADGRTARITVYLNRDPYGTPAMDLIAGIRNAARAPIKGSGLTVNVGGDTAVNADSRSDTMRDILLLGPIIFLAIGIILSILLRSVVAPLYLLATTLLSFFSTLGLTAVVFVVILGESGIQNFVPTFMAVFLIALGADYNVFIMSRIKEETHRIGLHDGTQRAVARTGGVITSAGLILAGTFAVLITLPVELLKQIGFAVAAGVLLDTFIVRALMVPSIVLLLGRWNWWPGRIETPSLTREALAGD